MRKLHRLDWSDRKSSHDANQLRVRRENWHLDGCIFVRATDSSRAFVSRVARLPTTSLPQQAKVQIAGMVEQFDQDQRGADFHIEFGAG